MNRNQNDRLVSTNARGSSGGQARADSHTDFSRTLPSPRESTGEAVRIKRRLTLIRDGGAWVNIFTPAGASSNTSTTASLLASEIARLAGSGPSVQTASSASRGIRVGLYSEWVAAGTSLPAWGADWTYAIKDG